MRKAATFIFAIISIMSLFGILGLIISSHNTADADGAQMQSGIVGDELPVVNAATAEVVAEDEEQTDSMFTVEAEKDSFHLHYGGIDTGLEIFFRDCVCEYDKDDIRVYTFFVDDPAVETEGYAIYIQTPEDAMELFPEKDYLIDKDAGILYMKWFELRDGIEIFTRIQGISFVNGINSYKVASTYSIEDLIGEAYGLELLDVDENFDCLQVEFTGLYEENGKTVLRGKASALYIASEKKYSIEWEIDTETSRESAKAYLTDFDIHPLYAAFLRDELSVKNPFVPEGDEYNTELSFFDDREYSQNFKKSFSLVDVNNDGEPELVFKMIDSPSELVYILGIQDDELICYDIHETHTSRMAFTVYDNGIVRWEQGYDGAEAIYYTYTDGGKSHELIHFVREESSDSDLRYDYYYLEGNEKNRFNLRSDEEYEDLVSSYKGEEPEWFACKFFADIPPN